MSESEYKLTKKVVKRNVDYVPSDQADNFDTVGSQRYQIYRGLSPDTSNRLELKIKSLEEALEAEKQARLQAEQEVKYLTDEMQLQNEQYDEMQRNSSVHFDLLRTKDQELQRLKQELDAMLDSNESLEVTYKKKMNEALNSMSEQWEQANRQKNKCESEKRNLLVEIGELNNSIELVKSAKGQVEARLANFEAEHRRLKLENDEKAKQLQELAALKSKLMHDNGEMQSKVKQLESANDNFMRDRSKFVREMESLQSSLEEAESFRPQMLLNVNNLQLELDNCRSLLEDEQQSKQLLLTQIQKLQSEVNSVKAKFESDLALSLEETETQKKKLLTRITEAENELSVQHKRSAKLEKDNSKLLFEMKELQEEIEKYKNQCADLSKQLKQVETEKAELRHQFEEVLVVSGNFESSQNKLNNELNKLKTQHAGLSDRSETLARELKISDERYKEQKELNEELKLQIQNVMNQKAQIEKEVISQNKTLVDLQRSLVEVQRQFDAATSEVKQVKDDCKNELKTKDDEMERLRKALQKASDDHHLQKLDLEVKHKNEINRAKKLFETELMQMRTDSEMHTKNYNEVLKSNKQLLNRTKDFEAEILNLDRVREDLKNQLNSCERKRSQLQMEKEDVSSRLDAAEKARKNTELTVKDLNQTVNELSLSLTSANNEVKRLNSDLISMQGVLEDSHVVRRNLEETTERFRLDADQLRESLEYHNDVIRQKDDVIQKLEKDLKITRELLDEMEQKTLREGRKLFAKAQAKSKSLELELEAEQKKLKELHSENRRLQKSINELADLKESFERETHEKSSLLDSAHNLIARLKKQLAEAEQVVTIVTGKYKKLQQRLNQEESDRQELSTPNNLQSVILERHISSAGSGGGQHATGSHLASVNQLTAGSHHISGSHFASGGHLVSGSHLASIGHLKPSVGHVGSSGLYTVGSRKSIPIGDMVNQRISTARSVVQSIIGNNSLNYE